LTTIMQTNQQEEDEDDCPICNESLSKLASKIARMTCCGKGMHIKCRDDMYKSSMTDKQKGHCIMCRTKKTNTGTKENIERIRRWVEKGKAWAQSGLGESYRHGVGVEQSYQRAIELFELSVSQGNASAQYNLGNMYREGQGVDQSYERAAKYYEAAAMQGLAQAQFNLGALYCNGDGVEQSNETAREWLIKAAEQGDEDAIGALQGLDKHEGRTTPSFTPPKRCSLCDTPEAPTHKLNDCPCFGAQYCNAECQTSQWKLHKKEHRRLCKEMNLKNTEGEMKDEVVVEEEGETKEMATADLQQHEEVEEDVCPVCIEALQKDDTKFIRYTCCGKGIHMWCDAGILVSSLSDKQKNCCPLCRTKYPTSKEETIERLRPWAEKGKAWAQSVLGDRYYLGKGVDQSYQQARELYELAANQGNAVAQFNLGTMYHEGQGVDQSYERAAEYCEAAAMQGHAQAQFNLGCLYVQGEGVEQSREIAREWLLKAAEQGREQGIKMLQLLDKDEGRTTPSFVPKPFECATCYRPHDPSENKLNACNRCHRVYYCGRECQKKHWKMEGLHGHKKICNKKDK